MLRPQLACCSVHLSLEALLLLLQLAMQRPGIILQSLYLVFLSVKLNLIRMAVALGCCTSTQKFRAEGLDLPLRHSQGFAQLGILALQGSQLLVSLLRARS